MNVYASTLRQAIETGQSDDTVMVRLSHLIESLGGNPFLSLTPASAMLYLIALILTQP